MARCGPISDRSALHHPNGSLRCVDQLTPQPALRWGSRSCLCTAACRLPQIRRCRSDGHRAPLGFCPGENTKLTVPLCLQEGYASQGKQGALSILMK